MNSAPLNKSTMTPKNAEHLRTLKEYRVEVENIIKLLESNPISPFVSQHDDYLRAFKKKRLITLSKTFGDADGLTSEYMGETSDELYVLIQKRGNFIFLGYAEREMDAKTDKRLVVALNVSLVKSSTVQMAEILKMLGCRSPKDYFDY